MTVTGTAIGLPALSGTPGGTTMDGATLEEDDETETERGDGINFNCSSSRTTNI